MSNIVKNLSSLPPIKKLVHDYEIKAKKSFGQNFIFDLNLTKKIAMTGLPFDGTIIEIGPGPGALTRSLLLQGANNLIAIEKDKRFVDFLNPLVNASSGKLKIIEGDALKTKIWELGSFPRQIIANLPYNISTQMLIKLLNNSEHFIGMSLMFQREVAQRIVAKSGEKNYSRISIFTNWRARSKILFNIPPEAFSPSPKIFSSLVRITPRKKPKYKCKKEHLETITSICFSQKRKMMRSILKKYGGEKLLENLKIDPSFRPQNLKLRDYCNLANSIFN